MRTLLPSGPSGTDLSDTDLDGLYRLPPVAPGTTHVRVNFVSSADGAAEVGGRSGPLGGDGDLRVFRTLRGLADVVLVGAGTVRAENYGGVKVSAGRRAIRVAAGQQPVPAVAVLTGRADLDPASRLFADTQVRPIVLTAGSAPAERRRALAEVADVVVCGQDGVDPAAALAALAERGLARVLCEGGPSLFATLADAGLVDELCLTLAPVLAGPDHRRILDGKAWARPRDLRLAGVLEQDGTLFLRYATSG